MRARVALTAIGVMIGTAAVVLLISLGVGLQTSTMASFESFGDLTTITVFEGAPFGFEDPSMARSERVMNDEVLAQFRAIPAVLGVTPRVAYQGGTMLEYGRAELFVSIQGLDPGAAEVLGWEPQVGAFRLGRGQIVLGARVLESSMGPRDRPGRAQPELTADQLQGRTVALVLTKFVDGEEVTRRERLRVAGVLARLNDQSDYTAFVGLEQVNDLNAWATGQRRSRRDGYNEALVKVEGREAVLPVTDAIREIGFESFSSQTILQGLNQVFILIQAVLGGVGAVALLVAAFGIANTMTMAIYERTREIGIMKALGATNREVLQIFLAEAGAIGALGGLLGVTVGAGGGAIIDLLVRNLVLARQGPPPDGGYPHIVVTPVWLITFALVFAALIGLVSGVYPALRAASMKPLQALRTE
jgi:putative ABC transport system permease protein